MKTIHSFKLSIFALSILTLTLNSCNKDKEESADTDSTIAENYSSSEKVGDDLDAISDEAESGNSLTNFRTFQNNGILGDSVVITKSTFNDTTYIVVDFGTGTTCKDDKVRKGKIKITRIGTPLVSGYTRTATTSDYYVDDNKVDATRVIVFKGSNSSNNPYWTIDATTNITLANSAGTIEGSTSRTREWTAGSSTLLDRTDDQFTISGIASGTKASGTSFTAEITTSLVRSVACQQFVKGVLTITPSGKKARVIDYGSGDCDGTATLTIGTYSKTISTKK